MNSLPCMPHVCQNVTLYSVYMSNYHISNKHTSLKKKKLKDSSQKSKTFNSVEEINTLDYD